MPADSAREIVKFTISIPRESFTNAKAKFCSSVVPPDPSVHFYHCPPRCYATGRQNTSLYVADDAVIRASERAREPPRSARGWCCCVAGREIAPRGDCDVTGHVISVPATNRLLVVLFFFGTDYMDSPDCLPILLSTSVFSLLVFLFSTF